MRGNELRYGRGDKMGRAIQVCGWALARWTGRHGQTKGIDRMRER